MAPKPDHFSQQDWEDLESPELSESDFKKMKPVKEVFPDIPDRVNASSEKAQNTNYTDGPELKYGRIVDQQSFPDPQTLQKAKTRKFETVEVSPGQFEERIIKD